jgi:hypothetical protein
VVVSPVVWECRGALHAVVSPVVWECREASHVVGVWVGTLEGMSVVDSRERLQAK